MAKIFKLTQETQKSFKRMIETALLQIGVKTEISFVSTNGNQFFAPSLCPIFLSSTDILCQPMMFKRVNIEGNLYVEQQNNLVYRLSIILSYKYETFQGGCNGTELGNMSFMLYLSDKDENQILKFYGLTLAYLG